MSKKFKIDSWYKIKHEEKEYPWPCKSDEGRKITLYEDDVLTRTENGKFMKHTGLGCFNIVIPDEDLVLQEKVSNLVML